MKSLILYGSPTKLTKAHKLVTGPKQPPYYVRVRFLQVSFERALDVACRFSTGQPRTKRSRPVGMLPGETILNSVPIQ